MIVFAALQDELPVEQAVRAEFRTGNKLLPMRWGDRALVGKEEQVAAWLQSSLRSDAECEAEEIILARKLGRGARPLALWGLKERLVYRAAVALIEPRVPPPDRSRETYESFQRAPLKVPGSHYVLKADIASYYQYIDHERLVDEVVAQTGDDLAITLATDVIRDTSGRRYGLPQLSDPSDVLAEMYIEPVRRQLVRAGFAAWRFADDFRIACKDYTTALAALETLDDAARNVGLILNELKTSTPRRRKYLASITAAQDREREVLEAIDLEDFNEPEFDWYGDTIDDRELNVSRTLLDDPDSDEDDWAAGRIDAAGAGEVDSRRLAGAQAIVDRWVDEEEDDETQRSDSAHVTSRLLGRAIRVFSAAQSTEVLDHVAAMLVYEPSLTPTIARHLQVCAAADRNRTRDALDEICSSGIVGAWQSLWIAHVAGGLSRRRGGDQKPHVLWLRNQLRSSRPSLVAEAALALGRRGLIAPDELLALSSALPPIHRPVALLALVAQGADDAAIHISDSQLDRLRIEWAREHLA